MNKNRILYKGLPAMLAALLTLGLSLDIFAQTANLQSVARPTVASLETEMFLEANPPGDNAVLVASLLERAPDDQAQKQLHARVQDGLLNGFVSGEVLARDMLNLLKLETDVYAYHGSNLVTLLQQENDILREHSVTGAVGALLFYQALSIVDFGQIRNTPSALADMLAAQQQQDGGFAMVSGGQADAVITAMVALALLPYADDPVVDTVVHRASVWLDRQQLPEGAFARNGRPSCLATAAVAMLLSLAENQGYDLSLSLQAQEAQNALAMFANNDGGYAAYPQGLSRVDVTEFVVLARFAFVEKKSPFLPPSQYAQQMQSEGTTAEQKDSTGDDAGGYGAFFGRFLAALAAIFLLLPATTYLGRLGEKYAWPGSFAHQEKKAAETRQKDAPKVPSSVMVDEETPLVCEGAEKARRLDWEATTEMPATKGKEAGAWQEDLRQSISPMEMPDFATLSEQDTNGAVDEGNWPSIDGCS